MSSRPRTPGPRPHAALSLAVTALFPALAAAQSSPPALLSTPETVVAALGTIVVSGSREPQPLDTATSDLVVIDGERLRDTPSATLEELLRLEAGLQLQRNGGPGKASGVFIRGATIGSTLVLIDGVRLGSATLGQAELEGLSLAQIDRIEIQRGPGSSLYGADAVGGVVQIFTRRGEGPPRVTAAAAVGGRDSFEGQLGLSGGADAFDYALSASHERSGGWSTLRPGDPFGYYNPDDDGYRRTTAQARLGYTPLAGHRLGVNLIDSRLDSAYDSGDFLPDFSVDASPDFRTRLHTQVLSADYRGQLSPQWTMTLQAAHGLDDSRSGAPARPPTESRFETRRDQLTWQHAWKPVEGQQLVAAYEYLREQAESASYVDEVGRQNHALLLGYTASVGAHEWQADLRHDHNSVYGDNATGRVGWSYGLSSALRVRAVYGTTFKAPGFNDLYYPGYGSPDVKPERGHSGEVGLTWREADREAALTLFRNQVRDLIEYESDRSFCPADPSYDFGCARNVGRARMQGMSVSGAQHWGGFGLRGTLELLDAKDTDTGERLNRRAARQASLVASYASGPGSASVAATNVGARPDGTRQLGGYTLVDLRGSWRLERRWSVEARLLNATNRDYEPVAYYQSTGRQAWIGLRYDSAGL